MTIKTFNIGPSPMQDRPFSMVFDAGEDCELPSATFRPVQNYDGLIEAIELNEPPEPLPEALR